MKSPTLSIAAFGGADRRPMLALAALSAAVVLTGLMLAGLVRAPRLGLIASEPFAIQLHIVAAVTALSVGAVLLAGPKGRGLHKALGWTWVIAMATVAISSLFITSLHPGRYSWIHLLSGWTIVALPMGVFAIRRRQVRWHRRTMTSLFVGGLLIAGAFTFVPGRLMWRVFFDG